VRVDESGRDETARRVDDLAGRVVDRWRDADDAPVAYRDVGAHDRAAGAVDDVAAPDHEVVHQMPPSGREQPAAHDLPIA
jgi:hypothetical protein